jgi:hypothetical protein
MLEQLKYSGTTGAATIMALGWCYKRRISKRDDILKIICTMPDDNICLRNDSTHTIRNIELRASNEIIAHYECLCPGDAIQLYNDLPITIRETMLEIKYPKGAYPLEQITKRMLIYFIDCYGTEWELDPFNTRWLRRVPRRQCRSV